MNHACYFNTQQKLPSSSGLQPDEYCAGHFTSKVSEMGVSTSRVTPRVLLDYNQNTTTGSPLAGKIYSQYIYTIGFKNAEIMFK